MQFYKQTTHYTCAASSLAMVINHFKPDFKLSILNEFDIWHQTAILPTRGSSIFSLAMYAHEKGIPLKVVVGEHEYKFPGYKFRSYTKTEVEIAKFAAEITFNKAKEAGIQIEERDFDFEEVKEHLKQGKILILRLLIGIVRQSKENKRNPHYVPVYGYENGIFKIMDPRKGPLKVNEQIVKEAFEKIDDTKRDPRMILFG